ncbi:MAG: hypothetical protein HUK18_06510 [Bacteroidales bacterium]|nr:hypothetical protein [Bacteroidales bacterium]
MKDISQQSDFMDFLDESVDDVLKRMGVLNEMAVPLKGYRARVDGLRFQLVENWCLCKWCQIYHPKCGNFAYWKSELKACMENLKFLEIKGGIDKKNTLKRMLVDDYDYDDPSMIIMIIRTKFNREKILDNTQREHVASKFADNIHGLINAISLSSVYVDDYIQHTFH